MYYKYIKLGKDNFLDEIASDDVCVETEQRNWEK